MPTPILTPENAEVVNNDNTLTVTGGELELVITN